MPASSTLPLLVALTTLCIVIVCTAQAHAKPTTAFSGVGGEGKGNDADANAATGVSYQIHSYNDLREWPQILRKGATWFKIDPHFMDSAFCAQQQRVNDSSHGCFVLSHDMPTSLRTTYNTTDDVIALLSSSELAPFFANNTRHITIALCFKWDYPVSVCSDSFRVAQDFLALADGFFQSIATKLLPLGLPVEFVVDGEGTPSHGSCLEQRFEPWVSTWIYGSDPYKAAVDNSSTDGGLWVGCV